MPVFIASDQHLGDKGVRDNFARPVDKTPIFNDFLDHVAAEKGKLILAGDLFDFWQVNLSRAILANRLLLDRLAQMGAAYIVGNHDSDLRYFIGTGFLKHPFFRRMCTHITGQICGRKFLVVHGHEADPYCKSDTPDMGRITAIASGLMEDKHGGPIEEDGGNVEDRFIGRLEWLAGWYSRIFKGGKDRFGELHANLRVLKDERKADVLITGHTHMPGRIGDWYYNTGSWARDVDSFVRVDDNGTIGVYNWPGPVPNTTELQHA
jgi:UDP-2,3-diacylglucosamine pyrophosphatase LpxH